jgi:hypothetical protein
MDKHHNTGTIRDTSKDSVLSGTSTDYRDKDNTMEDRDKKTKNRKNVLAPEVHQRGGEHSPITSEQQRYSIETNMDE